MTQYELNEYRQLRRDKKEAEQAIQDIDTSIDGLKSTIIDGMPHGSRRRAGLENIVARYEDQIERYYNKIAEIITKMERIENAVNSLPYNERRTLVYYYLKGERRRTYYQVAMLTNYSERQVRRYHERAIQRLKDF